MDFLNAYVYVTSPPIAILGRGIPFENFDIFVMVWKMTNSLTVGGIYLFTQLKVIWGVETLPQDLGNYNRYD